MNEFVSRETPPAPDVAVGVFSLALGKAERYAELLATEGVLRGLIGPREVPRLWERHLVNCALVGEAIPERADVCDIGSGAGLPGIVLALGRPDVRMTLVEPLLRRTSFLEEVVHDLDLPNVEIIRARAEELHGKREFEVVTSRAVAPLERLVAWSMPLVRQGGELVAMKGSSVEAEVARSTAALREFGAGAVHVEQYGEGLVETPTIVVRVQATRPSRLSLESSGSGQRPVTGSRKARRRRDR